MSSCCPHTSLSSAHLVAGVASPRPASSSQAPVDTSSLTIVTILTIVTSLF